jgi:hypothetical protein
MAVEVPVRIGDLSALQETPSSGQPSTMSFSDDSKEGLPAIEQGVSCAASLNIDPQVLKRAYRKIDFTLLAWYTFVVMLVRMEGHNVGNAVSGTMKLSVRAKLTPCAGYHE